jgi:hypothetical protein
LYQVRRGLALLGPRTFNGLTTGAGVLRFAARRARASGADGFTMASSNLSHWGTTARQAGSHHQQFPRPQPSMHTEYRFVDGRLMRAAT